MQSLHNVDKSFRKGEYIGYAHGVWHIKRIGQNQRSWRARHRDDAAREPIYSNTLAGISAKLDAIKA